MGNFSEHPRAPFVYEMAAKSHTALNDTVAAVKTKEELASKFNPESAWYKENFPNGDKDIDNLVSGTMLELARHYHSAAKESGNEVHMQNAIYWYTLYLAYFPDDPAAKETGFLLAEALFDSKRYLEAADRYESSMRAYGDTPEGEDAALNALLSLDLSSSGGGRPPEADEKTAASVKRITEAYTAIFKEPKNQEAFSAKASDIYVSAGMMNDARETPETALQNAFVLQGLRKDGRHLRFGKGFFFGHRLL